MLTTEEQEPRQDGTFRASSLPETALIAGRHRAKRISFELTRKVRLMSTSARLAHISTLLTIVLLIVFAAAVPAAADDSLSVIFGSAPNIFDALDLVAQGAGFFSEEHLNVVRDHVANAPTCAQLVATGKGDVCSMAIEPLLEGYEKGLRLQLFLARSAQYSTVLGVPLDSQIRTLADFKGTNIGEPTIGSAAEVATKSMLAGAGLGKSDYSFLPVGTGASGLNALDNKRVSGLAVAYAEFVGYEVVANRQFRFFRHPLLLDVPNTGYAATPATIQAKGDLLKRYARAIVKAALFIRTSPAAAARLYLQLQVGGGNASGTALQNATRELTLLGDYLPAADPSNKRIGYFPVRGIELYSKVLTDYGITTQIVPGAAVVTDEFIEFANDFDHRAVTALAKRM
jgi:NitT/TauT family transport system substrate-binding protein